MIDTLGGWLSDRASQAILGEDHPTSWTAIQLTYMGWKAAVISALNQSQATSAAWMMFSENLICTAENLLRDSEQVQSVDQTPPSRIDIMQEELTQALAKASMEDLAALGLTSGKDFANAVSRRAISIVSLLVAFHKGVFSESEMLVRAAISERAITHVSERLSLAKNTVTAAVSNGATALSDLYDELASNPQSAVPKLFVLVATSLLASGGLDGDGGAPDLDIPLMGIGEHRSIFTHSILMGSLLETAVLLLTRAIVTVHAKLPEIHDPLWDEILIHSDQLLSAAGKGASIGLAYHLFVDAFVQPAPYHGMPMSAPIEVHQTVMAANAAGEASAANQRPRPK